MIVYENKGNLVFSVPKETVEEIKKIKKASTVDENQDFDKRFFEYDGEEYFGSHHAINEAIRYYDNRVEVYGKSDKGYNFNSEMVYSMVPKKDRASVYKYKILHPEITRFFVEGMDIHKNNDDKNKSITNKYMFHLSSLVPEFESNLEELTYILDCQNEELAKSMLYKNYVEFAMFYYEIYPFVSFPEYDKYNIKDLRDLRQRTEELRMSTKYIDKILKLVPVAEQNTKIMTLLKKGRNNIV